MNCPTCNVQLLTTEQQETQIDYCPLCRVIWIGNVKLDVIIEEPVTEMTPKPISQGYDAHPVRRDEDPNNRHHDDHGEQDREKRSVLNDLLEQKSTEKD